MKKITILVLILASLLLMSCGAAEGENTTALSLKTKAKASLATSLSLSDSNDIVGYKYSAIESGLVKFTYYVKSSEVINKIYTTINSTESKSDYEIETTISDYNTNITSSNSNYTKTYFEFALAYTTNKAQSDTGNKYKTSQLEEIYNRSEVDVDEYKYNVKICKYMSKESKINTIGFKRSGKVFSLYINGNSVETFTAKDDVTKAFLLGYKYYSAGDYTYTE